MSHEECIKRKSHCHIFIDQIGDLGYGSNSLESLAMGIPTCSCLTPGFEAKYPDHPFVVVNETNLKQKILKLIANPKLRRELADKGRAWIKRHHDCTTVVEQIHKLASLSAAKGNSHPAKQPPVLPRGTKSELLV